MILALVRLYTAVFWRSCARRYLVAAEKSTSAAVAAAARRLIAEAARLRNRRAVLTALVSRLEEHQEDDAGTRVREPILDAAGTEVPTEAVDQVLLELTAELKQIDKTLKGMP